MDRLRITASIEVNTNTIRMEFWMTTDTSEKTTKSILIQLEGNLEWTLKQSQNKADGFVRVGRSQDQCNPGKGQRVPIGGRHGHTLILHLRLGRSRIKILMATSCRCVGREKRVDSGKSSLKGDGQSEGDRQGENFTTM